MWSNIEICLHIEMSVVGRMVAALGHMVVAVGHMVAVVAEQVDIL